jgi:yecA family protein
LVKKLAEYALVHMAMERARISIDVSELHGGMCGLLCSSDSTAVKSWVEDCLGEASNMDGALDAVRDHLLELELQSWSALTATDLEFYPLLPDDESDLQEQVSALALWCHGFLLGLGLGGVSLDKAKSDDAELGELAEIIHDFSEISRAGVSEGEFDSNDDPGFALIELVEYVRVSVQIVFEGLEGERIAPPVQATVH